MPSYLASTTGELIFPKRSTALIEIASGIPFEPFGKSTPEERPGTTFSMCHLFLKRPITANFAVSESPAFQRTLTVLPLPAACTDGRAGLALLSHGIGGTSEGSA